MSSYSCLFRSHGSGGSDDAKTAKSLVSHPSADGENCTWLERRLLEEQWRLRLAAVPDSVSPNLKPPTVIIGSEMGHCRSVAVNVM